MYKSQVLVFLVLYDSIYSQAALFFQILYISLEN